MMNRFWLVRLALLVGGVLSTAIGASAQEQNAKVLAKGEFHNADKTAKGMVTIYQRVDGSRVLQLTDFETEKGPDLHVRLIAAEDAKDTKSVAKADYVEVAKLKSLKGDQMYDLPEKIDLGKPWTVSIWCNRFSVNFAAAPLSMTSSK